MSRAEREPRLVYPLSAWGARLAAVLSVALAVALVWIWIETFYRGVSVNVLISFKSFDIPGIAGMHFGGPILGHHYFGDFQVPLEYARLMRHSISPYSGMYPEQYPPFVQVIFFPLTFLSLRTGAVLYLGASAAIFLVPLFLLLSPTNLSNRLLLLIPAALLTTPFISFMDRGNDIGITVGLLAFALWAWREERSILCAVLLVAAISLKAYPAALLVVPLALRRYKFTAIVAGAVAAVNLLVLALYDGGLFHNVRQVVPALRSAYSPLSQLDSWSLYSIVPKSVALLFGESHATGLLGSQSALTWLPAVLYVGALYFVIRQGRVPQWCWGPLALATMQVLVPVSYVYSTAWAALAAVWFAGDELVRIGDRVASDVETTGHTVLRVLLVLTLAFTLVPFAFTMTGVGGFETAVAAFLSPFFVLFTMCVAVFQSVDRRAGRNRRRSDGTRTSAPETSSPVAA